MPSTLAKAQVTLTHEDQSFESLTQPWVIADLNGNVIARFSTNAQAERHVAWKNYELVIDEQTTAQTELEQCIETQAQEIAPEPNRQFRARFVEVIEQHGDEFIVHSTTSDCYYVVRPQEPDVRHRCECPDCYFRSVYCKHQLAVKRFLRTQL